MTAALERERNPFEQAEQTYLSDSEDDDDKAETLALATPPRDNVDALVDYMKDPTSYDGEYSIADLHPSMRDAELYPAMRDLTDEELRLMAGYILVSPKVQGTAWGGGKIYF